MKVALLDWNHVPKEYKFRAVDGDGYPSYFTEKPLYSDGEWYNGPVCRSISGLCCIGAAIDSLEERPRPELSHNQEIIFKVNNGWKAGYTVIKDGKIWIETLSPNGKPFEYNFTLEWKYLNEL
jgi:hypothetical protein